MPVSKLAEKIANADRRHDNDYPLWKGPCGEGPLGGVTQSMLARFFSCRDRFRLKYVLGLEPHDKWNHRLGFGNMWHVCEEALAKADTNNDPMVYAREGGVVHYLHKKLNDYVETVYKQYPIQRDEIAKWYNVCCVQFPEYVRYWSDHPDVRNRTPLMQEQVFDVPYTLPSGRVVRLRGKFDSVDLIDGGIYLQENKTKGDIDKMQVERQLKFDLQTMLYLIALRGWGESKGMATATDGYLWVAMQEFPISGVRYNVIRRPLSGGKGSIRPHAAKHTKYKTTPAETEAEFYERLRRDYIAAEPDYWFFRIRAEISARDIQVFRETCLDPLLENLCCWYDTITLKQYDPVPPHCLHYRTPFGMYNALDDGGATEYDAYLESGSESGLCRVETLFPELQ